MEVIAWLNKEINDKNMLGATKTPSTNAHHIGMSHFRRPVSAFAGGNNSIHNMRYTKACATPVKNTMTTPNYGIRTTATGLCQRGGVFASQVTPNTETEIPKSLPAPCHFPGTENQARHFVPTAININRS